MAVTPRPHLSERSGWAIADPTCLRHRVWASIFFLCLAFGGLIARLWYLQVVEGAEMLAQAEGNRLAHVPLPAPRGLILDRHNTILATSRTTHSVAVIPAALPSPRRDPEGRRKILATLGFLLHTSVDAIETKIKEARDRGAHIYDPIRIEPDANYKILTQIEENRVRLGPAVMITDDLSRTYPQGALAAHVLGYTGIVTAEDLERNKKAQEENIETRELGYDDIIGKSGVERQYDAALSGERGSEQYEVDSRMRPVARRESIPEKPGNTVVLTLDGKLQRAAEKALDKARNSGAVAVVDVRTGEVLALASRPTFNPNMFSLQPKDFKRAYQAIVKNSKHPLINRAVTSRFPPGSTFKMVTAAAGLQQGTITAQSSWHCGGGLTLGRRFGCWSVHGNVNLSSALAGSCDVYFYQAALRMGDPESSGPTYLAKIARQFGLGQRTNIDLPTDAAGLIPDPAWRREYHKNNPSMAHWYPGNTLNMSIGQGDVLASPLQMALVTAAVANGGTLWQPHVLKEVKNAAGKQVQSFLPQGRSVGIEDRYLALVRSGMRRVVTSGTGRGIALPQVEIAGKSGSAEDANHDLPHAWFVAYAPYNNPRIAIAAIVENSGHGSENSVPVCKQVLEAAFPATKKKADSAD